MSEKQIRQGLYGLISIKWALWICFTVFGMFLILLGDYLILKKDAETYLNGEIEVFETLQEGTHETQIRLKYAADPLIEAVAIWDNAGELLFPRAQTRYSITDYAFTKSHSRLNALRELDQHTVWEKSDISARSLHYCIKERYRACLQINTEELAQTLNVSSEKILRALFSQQQMIAFAAASLLAGFMLMLVKGNDKKRDVSEAINPQSVKPDHTIKMRDMLVNPQRMCITRGEYECAISLRDLKILMCFHAHPDEVITKEVLYNTAWGREFVPGSRSLEQHIVTLRKKLDPGRSREPLILTVHGLGYRYPG